MRKLFLVFTMASFCFVGNAQENVIKANPLALLGGTDLVSYERAFGEHGSGVISAAIGGFKLAGIEYKSVGAGLQYRYYFDEVLSGFYGGLIADYQNGTVGTSDSDDEDFDFSSFGGGVKGGYQWVWGSGFSLDLNLGASYKNFDYDYGDSNEDNFGFKASGVLPTFGLGLGYAF